MTFDQRLECLRSLVKAAKDEILLVVTFHETWKPTVYDESLLQRMGNSYATHTFLIIRSALRREVLLGLMRLWDNNRQALSMAKIVEILKDRSFFDALVAQRAAHFSRDFDAAAMMREALLPKRDNVLELVRRYLKDGGGSTVLERLKTLRNQHLAHRQVSEGQAEATAQAADAADSEIEVFYADTIELVTALLSLVFGEAFDIGTDTAGLYQHHGKFFWAAVRGERTEGHPNYRPSM
ncbi:hypothetical protein CAL29_06755 [Bordetella genomosp. 10]|uniref:HEPN AbiU2-like domain-containing protein n=2 Tax=Bordetella genomosp. 10 TaxID=1416804 RepID=A0A261SKX2_9BORD|nr:hypothetical protein CAL29_06755 [Bordetella genomosp. 10]